MSINFNNFDTYEPQSVSKLSLTTLRKDMTKHMKKHKKKRVFLGILITAAAFFCSAASLQETNANAQEESADTAVFQILATGDLHGQATAYDYETDTEMPAAGLAKIARLVSSARKELGTSNTLLVDAGDFLYDYSTNYFYDNRPDVIQPILLMMKSMKYDCITLGNHEFDYPWEYLTAQLKASGLWEDTVVSNMAYEETMENVFAPSAVFTKEITTESGTQATLKIGVVGATRQALSTRRQYYGFLMGSDIYNSVKAEAKRLKEEEKVDLVIAVIHGGIGVLSGSNTNTHPGARLAKLDTIDAVVTSHSHEVFPMNDGTYSAAAYQKIVDEENGLIYGTPVVAAGSHGYGLGVITLNLLVHEDGSVTVTGADSEVRPVKEKHTEVLSLANMFNDYLPELSANLSSTKYPIAKGQTYTNLDCMVQDNDLFQLYNDAKLSYAGSYISEYLPAYEGLPVVACTANLLDNKESYLTISENFTSRKISALISETSIARDSGYIHIFKITGKKLKEWLEFNASVYATAGTPLTDLMPDYAEKRPNVSPLLRTDYFDVRTDFYVFDGISYEIDITQEPRYNSEGKVMNYASHRIQNLTYQGAPVSDSQEIILIMDSLAKRYSFMPEDSESIFTTLPWKNGKDIFLEYLEELSASGPIQVKADNNWKINFPKGYQFVIGMPYDTRSYIEKNDWFASYAATYKASANFPVYYRGTATKLNKLTQSLNVVLSADNLVKTSQPVTVKINASCAPETSVSEILYLPELVTKTDAKAWKNAEKVKNNEFIVKENGRYTVRVTDTAGNQKLATISIENLKKDFIDTPVVTAFNNRITNLKGTASPNVMVLAKLPDGSILSTISDDTGAFLIEVPSYQRAFETIQVWASSGDLVSETVDVIVRKTGANIASLNPIASGDRIIYGTTDPNTTVYFRIGNTIYVDYNDVDRYLASDFFKDTYKVKTTNIYINDENVFMGVFNSPFKNESKVWVYALDKSNRSSKGVYVVVGAEPEPGEEPVDPSEFEEEPEESEDPEKESSGTDGTDTSKTGISDEIIIPDTDTSDEINTVETKDISKDTATSEPDLPDMSETE